MKYYSVLLAIGCGVTTGATVAMFNNNLTPEEDDCFDWIHSLKSQCAIAFNRLSVKDQALVQQSGDSDAICAYVENIFAILKANKFSILYNQALAIQSMVKVKRLMHQPFIQYPIGPTTARLWVYNIQLTEQEKTALQKDNYLKDPNRAYEVCTHYARMVVDKIEEIDKSSLSMKYKDYYDETVKEFMIEQIARQKNAAIQQLYCEK